MPRSTRDPGKQAIWREGTDGWKTSPLSVTVYCKEDKSKAKLIRMLNQVYEAGKAFRAAPLHAAGRKLPVH